MSDWRGALLCAVTALVTSATVMAQHQGHQPSSPSAAPAELGECLQAQHVVNNIISAASERLETARQSNSPSDMRAAIDQFGAVLRDIQKHLEPCASAAAKTGGHGHPDSSHLMHPGNTFTWPAVPDSRTGDRPGGVEHAGGHHHLDPKIP